MTAELNDFLAKVAQDKFDFKSERVELKKNLNGEYYPAFAPKPRGIRWLIERLFGKNDGARLTTVSDFLIDKLTQLEDSPDKLPAIEKLNRHFHSHYKVSGEWDAIMKRIEIVRCKTFAIESLLPSSVERESVLEGENIKVCCKNGEELEIHPSILAKLPPGSLFENYLNTDRKEPMQFPYSVEDAKPFFDYCCGRLDESLMTIDQHFALLELADRFNMDELKTQVTEHLKLICSNNMNVLIRTLHALHNTRVDRKNELEPLLIDSKSWINLSLYHSKEMIVHATIDQYCELLALAKEFGLGGLANNIKEELKFIFSYNADLFTNTILSLYTTRGSLKDDILPLTTDQWYLITCSSDGLVKEFIKIVLSQENIRMKVDSSAITPEEKLEKSFLQTLLAYSFQKGIHTFKDPVRAVERLRPAADQGYAPAICMLGTCYIQGLGVKKDEKIGIEHYEKAMANKYAYANYCMGMLVCKKQVSSSEYYSYFEKAVEGGCYLAAFEKGKIDLYYSLYRNRCGIDKKLAEIYSEGAFNCFNNSEHINPVSQYLLGFCYYWGVGVEQDREKADLLYSQAAARGCSLDEYEYVQDELSELNSNWPMNL
ncbi:MAG: hypothetical protein P4L16_06290 [Chlamydiales bacterium]|nr:hypothetical protein [Chlamydiales bacterium]